MTKVIAKFAGVALAVAFAVTAAAPANALTAADIQLLVSLGVIPADKADAAMALAGGSTSTGATAACGSYTRDLTVGSTGADVVALQTYLEAKGHLVIPTGVSKGYFGPLTRSALASYQAAMGISPAVGYFGPITRANVLANCGASTGDMDDDDSDSSELSGGEASLVDYDSTSEYNNEDLEEGETGKVFAAEFEVEDGDARVERIDVKFEAITGGGASELEDEPWKQFEEVALYINGEEVDSMNADDEDDWSRSSSSDNTDDSRAYELRFTGLDEVFQENDEVEVVVEVTVQDSLDSENVTQRWKVWIPENGIRAVDGEGIDQYTGSDDESKNFDVEAADDGEVDIQESDDDLDPEILIVDDEEKKGPYEVFVFEIDNEEADIFLNTLTLVASTSDDDIEDVVSDITVEIDGEEFSYDTASSTGTSNVGEYTFDFEDNDDEIPVEQDETVEVVVMVEFNQVSGYEDGDQFQVGVGYINGGNYGSVGVTAEGQQTGDASDVSGRIEGSVHTLRTEGIALESVSESFSYRNNTTDSLSDDEGIYTFEVQITALEEDAWIDDNVSTTASTTAGFVALVTGNSFSGTSSARIAQTSADVETNNRYKVSEGTSETFTIVVELDPSAKGAFGLELDKVNFASSSTGTQAAYTVPDENEYELPTETIQN